VKSLKTLGSPRRWTISHRLQFALLPAAFSDRHTQDRPAFVRDIASTAGGNAPLVDAIIAMARSLFVGDGRRRRWKPKRSAISQSSGRESGSGLLVLPPITNRRLGALARDWLHAHQPEAANVA